MFKTGLCSDAYKPFFSKLGVIIYMTKFHILVRVHLTVTQGHRITRKLVLVQSLYCEVAWNSPYIRSGWLCKGDDFKESQ